MLHRLLDHVRHNVVGYIAVFIALSGTAYAAKPMITGDDVFDESLTGADVKNDTVKGADVDESSLSGISPNGAAGGDLTGAYPNPSIAQSAIDSGKVNDNSLTDADIAVANKDGTAVTPSLRTLGTGSQQAAAGDDPRLSDARTPTGAAGGDLAGTYPNPTVADGAVGAAKFSSTIPAARVAGNFTNVPNNSPTALPWQSADVLSYDSANLFSGSHPSRLTAPVTGVYRLSVLVFWPFNSTGARDVGFLRNGGQTVGFSPPMLGDSGQFQQASTEVELDAGDYVEVSVRQASGVTLNGVDGVSFTMSWVAPG